MWISRALARVKCVCHRCPPVFLETMCRQLPDALDVDEDEDEDEGNGDANDDGADSVWS